MARVTSSDFTAEDRAELRRIMDRVQRRAGNRGGGRKGGGGRSTEAARRRDRRTADRERRDSRGRFV